MKFRVEYRQVIESGAYVEADDIEQAARYVKIGMQLAEDDGTFDSDASIEWDFPQPLDIQDVQLTSVRMVV